MGDKPPPIAVGTPFPKGGRDDGREFFPSSKIVHRPPSQPSSDLAPFRKGGAARKRRGFAPSRALH
jgi:hypothetical protein